MSESEIPSLISLCIEAIKNELLRGNSPKFPLLTILIAAAFTSTEFNFGLDFAGDDLLPIIHELPSDLFDILVLRLPPLALQKLQTAMYA